MTINPSPLQRAFICPLCGEAIEAMDPTETKDAPSPEGWVPNLSLNPIQNAVNFAMAQNMAANEAIIWAHFESHHTLREAVLALGRARNALMEIVTLCDDVVAPDAIDLAMNIEPVANRGLGDK